MRALLVAATFALLAGAASGSLIEDSVPTGLRYQHDGGVHGDASDACASPGPELPFRRISDGVLVPVDDREDDFAFTVPPGSTGSTYAVEVRPGVLELATGLVPNVDVEVYEPGCVAMAANSTLAPGKTEYLTFTATVTGTWTIRVVDTQPTDPYVDPVIDLVTDCHPVCIGNLAAGYLIEVS